MQVPLLAFMFSRQRGGRGAHTELADGVFRVALQRGPDLLQLADVSSDRPSWLGFHMLKLSREDALWVFA